MSDIEHKKCKCCGFDGDVFFVDMGEFLLCQNCILQSGRSLLEWSIDMINIGKEENAKLKVRINQLENTRPDYRRVIEKIEDCLQVEGYPSSMVYLDDVIAILKAEAGE